MRDSVVKFMLHIGSEALICILSLIRAFALSSRQSRTSTFSHFYFLVASEALKLYKPLSHGYAFNPSLSHKLHKILPCHFWIHPISSVFRTTRIGQNTTNPINTKYLTSFYLHPKRNLPIHLLCCPRMYSTEMYPSPFGYN